MTRKLVGDRMVLRKADLEKKLLAYLRKAGRCIDADGVVVAPVAGAGSDKANWTIAAVDYGRAPKSDCDEELTRIAPLFLRHFNIAPESGAQAAAAPQPDAAPAAAADAAPAEDDAPAA
jgi:hypothetical protein